MDRYYQILRIKNGRQIVDLNIELFEVIKQTFQLQSSEIQQEQENKNQAQKFQRRIVPFFLNQFRHWSKKMQYHEVECYLKILHNKKTSKQQKWELGDLQKIFGPVNLRTRIIQAETQLRWSEFINSQAELCVIVNSKIKDQITKQKYIDAIDLLKQELKKNKPYQRFLSMNTITNKQNSFETNNRVYDIEFEQIYQEEPEVFGVKMNQYSTDCFIQKEENQAFQYENQ